MGLQEPQQDVPSHQTSGEFGDLLSRHLRLAKLELALEKAEAGRRIRLFLLAGLLFTIGFCFLQIAIFTGLVYIGIPGWAAGLLLGFFYVVMSGVLALRIARRNPTLGSPFEGSEKEFQRTVEWISKRFF